MSDLPTPADAAGPSSRFRRARVRRHHVAIATVVLTLCLAVAAAALLPRHPATVGRSATGPASGTRPAPTPDPSFAARVSDLCEPYARAVDSLVFPYPTFDPLHPTVRLLPSVARFEQEHYGTDRLLAALLAETPPSDQQTAWTQLIDLIAQQVRTVRAQIAAAARSDPAAFTATADTLHGVIPQLDAALRRVGLGGGDACATALEN